MCPKKVRLAVSSLAFMCVLLFARAIFAATIVTQWTNVNQPGFDMTNIVNQPATTRLYDAYGSWWDDGTGMKFYSTLAQPGQNHPDNRVGHGYVPSTAPLLYYFTDSFMNHMPHAGYHRVLEAFDTWDSAINGTAAIRNVDVDLGFSWDPWMIGSPAPQINIKWQEKGGAAAWVLPTVGGWGGASEALDLTFVDQYCSGGIVDINGACSGTWTATSFYTGTDTPGGVLYDMTTVTLHELGHLIGLDDLYGLSQDPYYGFPDSIMGTAYASGNGDHLNPSTRRVYRREIDLGSLQGALDLYTTPEPSTWLLLVSAVLLLGLGRVQCAVRLGVNELGRRSSR